MITLSQARQIVYDHLDDPNEDRWNISQVDRALSACLSQCIEDYVASGGDRLDSIVDKVTTSGGEIDLSTESPLTIKGVSLFVGNRYWPIKAMRFEQRNISYDVSFNTQVRLIRKYHFPVSDNHPLVGRGPDAAPVPEAFAQWVCAKAALFCAVKDAEPRNELRAVEQDFKVSVLMPAVTPHATPFPISKSYYSDWYAWIWKADEKKLIVVRTW